MMAAPLALTVPQTAELLGCSESHVFRLLRKGVLPAADLDGVRRVPRVALERWLEERTNHPGPEAA